MPNRTNTGPNQPKFSVNDPGAHTQHTHDKKRGPDSLSGSRYHAYLSEMVIEVKMSEFGGTRSDERAQIAQRQLEAGLQEALNHETE